MAFILLVAAFIFLYVRYLWQKNAPRPLDILHEAVDKWRTNRMTIIEKLREAASLLKNSHRQKAETEQTSAKKCLVGDLIGIGGVLLAPFSGGLSLVAAGASVFTSVDSYLSDKAANKEHEENAAKIKEMIEEAEELDKTASDELNKLLSNFDDLEEQLCSMKLGDIMTSLHEASLPTMGIKVQESKRDTEQDKEYGPLETDELLPSDAGMEANEAKNDRGNGKPYSPSREEDQLPSRQGLMMPKQIANLDTVMNCAEHVVNGTKLTKEVSSKTKPATEITSWTRSVSTISKESKTLSNVKYAKNTIKTVKAVKKASTAVKTISKATSHSHKIAKTSQITTKTLKLGKASHAATKVAKISKVGLVINAVALPLDIYNLIQTTGNLDKMQDDVKEIEDRANHLEEELENIYNCLLSRRRSLEKLHKELYKLYQDHHIDEIFEYLLLMYEKLDFDTPVPY